MKKVKKPVVFPEKIFSNTKMKTKNIGFTIKPERKRSGYGFGPWVSHTRLEMLWGTLTDKLFREKSIGFTVKMQKSEKTIGFTVKKFKKEQKPL